MRSALLLALVACSHGASHAPLTGTADTAFPPRATPAPSIEWTSSRFEWHGLPAIARDRSIAVVPLVDNDSARGYPNLRIEVKSRDDHTLEGTDVLIANDFEQLVMDDKPVPELAGRITAMNKKLGDLHREHDLVPMQAASHSGDPLDETPPVFHTKYAQVKYDHGALHVTLANRSFDVDGTRWKAPTGKRCPACDPCANPEFVREVYAADDVDALIVDIGYRGTDSCWEPGDQLHVITW
ncbi:MAG TPA: hypothetical protein VLB44_15405 [Kofleriaceae bacterium]|nr:hypothetical protein [Kofleriaceae bacterium]